MKRLDYDHYKNEALKLFNQANIVLTQEEIAHLEIADFGLNDFEKTGLSIVTYVNTERVCAKELVLLPNQTCPEHIHPNTPESLGKEETFRCRYGKVHLFVEGPSSSPLSTTPPSGDVAHYSVFHEIILVEGQQYTLTPNTKHWFKSGKDGAVISEFSTHSSDENDIFTDTRIKRLPEIEV